MVESAPMIWSLAALVMFAGAFVQCTIGFGLAVVAAPILYLLDPAYVPGPIIATALMISLLNSLRFRSQLALGRLGWAVLGRVPGCVLGIWILTLISPDLLSLLLGGAVLLAVVASLVKSSLQASPRNLFWAGLASGFMGTSSSIGGPPMALVLQNEEASSIRANLSGFFVISCLMSLGLLGWAGLFGAREWHLTLGLLAPAALGFVLSTRIATLEQHLFRPVLLLLCTLSALFVIFSAI
ncbi:sulfite exporter TauE/SafE family protein [Aestuariirhabdus litorea]|uniref:Probable membrane transporter protein n=1 Tax=Aestuariirhabdus litorea TaxID=2528527 RepID=A0A3P3VRI4_9GAMM|nr:sulfite exporter TauE/SafE family protein [Aestuariirhabdus litorea]RRJ85064.1 sulfite exporter TauE/SafE family protein [Aestuariirhabdus litorea]RWW98289.1 sulfite exporter TauE/SafE family protein [Endozoicomonadaceae bacterium GTF-13]